MQQPHMNKLSVEVGKIAEKWNCKNFIKARHFYPSFCDTMCEGRNNTPQTINSVVSNFA